MLELSIMFSTEVEPVGCTRRTICFDRKLYSGWELETLGKSTVQILSLILFPLKYPFTLFFYYLLMIYPL